MKMAVLEDRDREGAAAIAASLRAEREARGWSLSDLADRSGVSKAMISKIERCESSPTATVLGKLSGAFGLPLSVLLATAERAGERVLRRERQPVWRDPETGYIRRAVSPPNGGHLELVEIELPPGVAVPYPASAFAFQFQQIWVLEGSLAFHEDRRVHVLGSGDCLQLGAPANCTFENTGTETVRYVVALTRRWPV